MPTNHTAPISYSGGAIVPRHRIARLLDEVEHGRVPVQRGAIRTPRGTLFRRGRGHPGPSAYTGPFRCTKTNDREITVGPGWVRAGHAAEWSWPGTTAGRNTGKITVTGNAGTNIIFMDIAVDPYDPIFNSVYYPELGWIGADTPDVKNFPTTGSRGTVGGINYTVTSLRVPLCTFEMELFGASTWKITSVYQRQYGDIWLPVFWEFFAGTNAVSPGDPLAVSRAYYTVGMIHGHYTGAVVAAVPGVATNDVTLTSPGASPGPFAAEEWGG